MWVLVFGFLAGKSRTSIRFRWDYNSTIDEPISLDGFCHRSTPTLTEYFSDSIEHAEAAYRERVAGFPEFRAVLGSPVGNGLSIGFVSAHS